MEDLYNQQIYYVKGQISDDIKIICKKENKSFFGTSKVDTVYDKENYDQLKENAEIASFGINKEEVIDKEYRNALTIKEFDITCDLSSVITNIEKMCGKKVRFEKYRINIYQKDGEFKQHMDTPHNKDFLGTIVLCLNRENFEGGDLYLKQGNKTNKIDFDDYNLVAFLGDTIHWIEKVTSGERITVTFNIFKETSTCIRYMYQTEETELKSKIKKFLKDNIREDNWKRKNEPEDAYNYDSDNYHYYSSPRSKTIKKHRYTKYFVLPLRHLVIDELVGFDTLLQECLDEEEYEYRIGSRMNDDYYYPKDIQNAYRDLDDIVSEEHGLVNNLQNVCELFPNNNNSKFLTTVAAYGNEPSTQSLYKEKVILVKLE